jgi:chromosome segregation ATPase
MPEVQARLDRIESHIERLASITGELARDVRTLVEGLASDRVAFRETLRDLSGFVATAGLEMNQLGRQIQRLAEVTEAGFAGMQTLLGANNQQIAENNRQLTENNRQIAENNRVIRQLLDILARGRGNGEGPPPSC